MNVIKPMLAKDGDLSKVTFPVVAQPKLDGIRAFVVNGELRSRTFKLIPNKEIQDYLARPEFEGLDGEIIVGEPTAEGCMQITTSFVMAPNKTGENWTFHVFDKWNEPGGFWNRFQGARETIFSGGVKPLGRSRLCIVESLNIINMTALDAYEVGLLEDGHEGVIVRDPSAPYKHGRSGVKGPLLKVKRFIDFEARITGVYELMHNGNEATKDAFGRTERSTVKANKSGLNALGGFELVAVNGPSAGIAFRCGTGFKREQRQELWLHRVPSNDYKGMTVKIKSFPVGVKDAPRFPVFLGFRDLEIDG